MKTLNLILLLLTNFVLSAQGPIDGIGPSNDPSFLNLPTCHSIEFNYDYSNLITDYLTYNCEQEWEPTEYEITITKDETCLEKDGLSTHEIPPPNPYFCFFDKTVIRILLDGNVLHTAVMPQNQVTYIIHDFISAEDIANLDITNRVVDLSVEVTTYCLQLLPPKGHKATSYSKSSRSMQYVRIGDTYEVFEDRGYQQIDFHNYVSSDAFITACGYDKVRITTREEDAKIYKNNEETTWTLTEYKVQGKVGFKYLDFSTGYEKTFKTTYSNLHQKQKLIRVDYTQEITTEVDEIAHFKLILGGTEYLVKTYVRGCEGDTYLPEKDRTEIVPNKIFSNYWTFFKEGACENHEIRLETENFTTTENSDSRNRSGDGPVGSECRGDIRIITDGIYDYNWEGPNGLKSNDQNLYFVEFGKYTVTITDACCTEIIEEVFLCDEETTTNWELNTSTGKYCKKTLCSTCDEDPVIISEKCIDAELVYSHFDESSKECVYSIIVDGETVGTQVEPAVEVEKFENDKCVMEYYCGTMLEESEPSDPVIGNWWGYDFLEKKCTQDISCFGTTVSGEYHKTEPEMQWSYNENNEKCTGERYCNGINQFDNTLPQEPNNIGDWEVTGTTNITCTRTIICVMNGEEFTEDGEWSFEPSGETCTDPAETSYYVLCNGENTFETRCYEGLLPTNETSVTRNTPNALDVKIYPNPVQNILHIELSENIQNANVELYNTNGVKVLQTQITGQDFIIDVSKENILNGVYFLRIKDPLQNLIIDSKVLISK